MESMNGVNSNMKNPPLNVGVIMPPDYFYKPVLYSDYAATQNFNRINQDIYSSAQKSKSIDNKKTPISVFVTLAIASMAIAFPFIKKYIK